jgi:hypothetical protein
MHNNQFVEIARGDHHGDVKATLYDVADEVYVIAPLGKLLMWNNRKTNLSRPNSLDEMMRQLNQDLKYKPQTQAMSADKVEYEIVSNKLTWPRDSRRGGNITDWLKKSVLVTTRRTKESLFHQHYLRVEAQIQKSYYPEWGEETGPYVWTSLFDDLPISLLEQCKLEIPHDNLRRLRHKYFYLPLNWEATQQIEV